MSSSARQIRIRGTQREQIDVDLLAHVVLMLGRQLAREAGDTAHAVDDCLSDAHAEADDVGRDSP